METENAECNKSSESEYYEYYTEPGSNPLLLSSSELHLVASHYSPDTGETVIIHQTQVRQSLLTRHR
jgi:hypothetical protein